MLPKEKKGHHYYCAISSKFICFKFLNKSIFFFLDYLVLIKNKQIKNVIFAR